MAVKQIAAFYFFHFCIVYCFAQNATYRFDNLTEKQGLADANIASIVKDSKGYMWFASSEGLNRFDGTKCHVYRHSNADSNSLSADNINAVFNDSKQRLWIATRNGLNLYDPVNDHFKSFHFDSTNKNSISSNEVWSLSEDRKGNIWIGTMGGGLNKLIELKDRNNVAVSYQFVRFGFDPADSSSLSDNSVWSIAFDNRGRGWLGTNNGLNCFSAEDAADNHLSFTRHFNTPGKNSLTDNLVWRVWADNDNNLVWLLSFTKMLDCISTDQPENDEAPAFIHVRETMAKKLRMNDLGAMSIARGEGNSYWIGTDQYGLIHCTMNFNKAQREIIVSDAELITHNEQDAQGLVNNLAYDLYRDENELIWIGTENGISRYTPQKKFFNAAHLNATGLADMPVKVSYSDDRYTWFANGNALWVYHKQRSLIHPICILDYPEITCLHTTPAGDLLIGTSPNGIFYLTHKQIATFFEQDGKPLLVPEKFSIKGRFSYDSASIYFFSSVGKQVIAGGYEMIGLLDTDNRTFENFYKHQYTNDPSIFRCITTAGSKHYVGTDNGLFTLDQGKTKYVRFQPIKNKLNFDRINSLLFRDNKLWIATVSGLNIYDVNTRSLKSYSIADGLPDNNILSLCSDGTGDVWMGTRNGLSRFNAGNATFSNFHENEGLNTNQLNALSFDGNILFAATDKGINSIIPSSLKATLQKRNIVISDFKVAGKSVLTYPLTENGKALKHHQPIKINWHENNVSIQFNALEYINPGMVKYAFILEGFETKWTYNENNTIASYTNLPGGKYTFKIKYAGSDGQWHESDTTIRIHVATAWFRAWWFYVSCCLVAIGLCYAYYRMRLNRILEMQSTRNKIARDLHDDIGSTLSTIKILSGAAEKKLASDVLQSGKMLHKITESADRMMDAMSDIVWSINPANDSLDNIVVRMREYAARALEPNDIAYKVLADERAMNIKLKTDKRKDIFLLYKEAVNNIAKYAKATEAHISLHVHQNIIELAIRDNGKGFDATATYTGNGLKNIQQRAVNMGGSCQVRSTKGEGTTVHAIIPIT